MCVDYQRGFRCPKVRAEIYSFISEGLSDTEISSVTGIKRGRIYHFRWYWGINPSGHKLQYDRKRKDNEHFRHLARQRLIDFSNESVLWGSVIREAINDVIRCCKKGRLDANGSRSMTFLEGGGNFKLATLLLKNMSVSDVSGSILDAIESKYPVLGEFRTHRERYGKGIEPNPKGLKSRGQGRRRSAEIRPKYQHVASGAMKAPRNLQKSAAF